MIFSHFYLSTYAAVDYVYYVIAIVVHYIMFCAIFKSGLLKKRCHKTHINGSAIRIMYIFKKRFRLKYSCEK